MLPIVLSLAFKTPSFWAADSSRAFLSFSRLIFCWRSSSAFSFACSTHLLARFDSEVGSIDGSRLSREWPYLLLGADLLLDLVDLGAYLAGVVVGWGRRNVSLAHWERVSGSCLAQPGEVLTLAVVLEQRNDLVDYLDTGVSATLGLAYLFGVSTPLGDEIHDVQHDAGYFSWVCLGSKLSSVPAMRCVDLRAGGEES